MIDTELAAIGAGVLVIGVSAYLLWSGLRNYRYGKAIAGAVPFDATSTLPDLVVVEGVVNGPVDGASLESGMSATPCVAYSERRTTKKAHRNEDVRRAPSSMYRERVKERTDSIPFVLDTDDGFVQVEALEARVEVPEDDYTPVSLEDVRQNRGPLVGLYWLVRSILTHADRQSHREYEESCFAAGDPISAIGSLNMKEATDEWVLKRGDAGPLVVTSHAHSEVAETFQSAGKGRLFWGVLGVMVGIAILASVAGII